MIDVSKYTLIYFHKESGKEVRAHIPERGQMNILEDGKIINMSMHHARKIYRGCKSNRQARNKPIHARPRMARRATGFEKYLNESFDKLVSGMN